MHIKNLNKFLVVQRTGIMPTTARCLNGKHWKSIPKELRVSNNDDNGKGMTPLGYTFLTVPAVGFGQSSGSRRKNGVARRLLPF